MNTINGKKLVGSLLLLTGMLCGGTNPAMAAIPSESSEKSEVVETADLKIKGVITDKDGEPLSGALVLVKGTKNVAVVDVAGNYEIEAPNGATIQISLIGYKTVEIIVAGQKEINITMQEDMVNLDGVVVIGYGTTSLRKNTSSIATVDNKALIEVPYSDMATALQGRVPGVIVQQGSAEPGQNGGSISIRGNGEPLYVIDGFVSNRSRFLNLNKADIKSTTILKDAASTAVYGMNAGNGVILVTTKAGQIGKLAVDYQGNFAFNQLSYPTERMNAYEYAYAINNLNQGLGYGINSFKTPQEMEEIAQNLDKYTNWEDVTMRKSAPQTEHTMSLSGGNDKLKFFGSLNYLTQDGIYTEDVLKYDRYNYRSNASTHFDKVGLTIGMNLNGTIRDEKYPPASAWTIYSRIRDRNPFEKPFTSDGKLSNQFDNPMLILQGPGNIKLRTIYNQLAMNADWDVPWIEGLSFGVNGNYNVESHDRKDWIETATYYDEQGNATVDEPSNISITRSSYSNYHYDINFKANYQRTFANAHNVLATLIQSRQYYHGNGLSAGSNTFYTTAIQQIQKGDAESITASNSEIEQASMGYVGRLRYDYNNRYMVELTGRYDGSDDFPTDKRFGFFPAASLGWAISEEGFFQKIKQSNVISFMKLRASYGQVGINGANHAQYAYLPSYNYNTNGYVVDGKLVNTVTPGPTPSYNMTWYTRDKYDAGIDLSFFEGKLEVTADWFFEKTKGYLSSASYIYVDPLGYSLPLEVSQAENRNEGIDGYVKYSTKFGDIFFSAGVNFTYYNTIAFKTNEDSITLSNPRIRQQGNKNNYVGTGYIGTQFYDSPYDVLNNPKRATANDLRPGDLWYADVNGDGKIDGQDQSRYGHNSSPNFVYGIDLSASYKGLSVMAVIQGTGPRQTYFSEFAMGKEGERRLDFSFQNDFWTPNNPNATLPRPGNLNMNSNNNYASSDFWARDSYYVRLKSLTISYDLKHTLLKKEAWLSGLKVFASGINLFAFGPTVKYGDPEANNFDGYSYPMTRTISFGFQLGF